MASAPKDEIIQDLGVFDDGNDDFELLNRDGEMKELFKRLGASLANHVLITGSSGVGKSMFAHKALDRINNRQPIDQIHINCFGKTTTAIKREVVEDHSHGPNEVGKTTSERKVDKELDDAIGNQTVVVLDEASHIHRTDSIRELSEFDVTLIAIAHDPNKWLHKQKKHGDTEFKHIQLEKFSTVELAHILDRRARQGFHNISRVITRDQLEELADDVSGIARKGIQRLWAAADIATEREHHQITDADLEDGKDRALTRIRQMNLRSLPYHHQVLYAIVHEFKEVTGEQLHERYDEIADAVYQDAPVEPIGVRGRRKKFPKLEQYDLVRSKGNTKAMVYKVIDENVEPERINLPGKPAAL